MTPMARVDSRFPLPYRISLDKLITGCDEFFGNYRSSFCQLGWTGNLEKVNERSEEIDTAGYGPKRARGFKRFCKDKEKDEDDLFLISSILLQNK